MNERVKIACSGRLKFQMNDKTFETISGTALLKGIFLQRFPEDNRKFTSKKNLESEGGSRENNNIRI